MVLLSCSGTGGGIYAKLANGVAQYNCAQFPPPTIYRRYDLLHVVNKRIIAITGQCLPVLRCVKYCTLRGRSGYIFTSPITPRYDENSSSHLRLCNARWIPGTRGRHEPNSCRYAVLKSQQRLIRTQTRSEITLFECKKSS